jgi:GT2 family glycosyltransferase
MVSKDLSNIKFAGFIMTYERADILEQTIEKILSQSIAPKKLLIVDNSESNATELMIKRLQNPILMYHKVGNNSGPAGAAKIGLEVLSKEGFDWIYWGDDDDAPIFQDTFKILLDTAVSNDKCGCVGVVGQYFNRFTGFVKRVPNELLQSEGVLDVDTIAGGMSKIVNGDMIRKYQIFPDEKLFFGMEELDFDLKIKKIGYTLLVDRQFYYQHRLRWNRVDVPNKSLQAKSNNALVREYYSIRNGLYIYSKNRLVSASIIFFFYYATKQIISFKFGINQGKQRLEIFSKAISDLFYSKMGRYVA